MTRPSCVSSGLEPSAAVRPLGEALSDATRWLETKKDFRGEIYVFTDMAAEAWPQETLATFGKSLEQLPGVERVPHRCRRVGTERLGAWWIKVIERADCAGRRTAIEHRAARDWSGGQGNAKRRLNSIWTTARIRLEKRGQQVVALSRERPAPVEFSLSGLKLGTHQGFVRIVGRDGLACDDMRYFTVEVRPPSKVLLLAEKPMTRYFCAKHCRRRSDRAVQSKFDCQVSTFDQLNDIKLADFAAVCLLDPPPLPNAAWQSLASFAESRRRRWGILGPTRPSRGDERRRSRRNCCPANCDGNRATRRICGRSRSSTRRFVNWATLRIRRPGRNFPCSNTGSWRPGPSRLRSSRHLPTASPRSWSGNSAPVR